jgi:hypothetical protein
LSIILQKEQRRPLHVCDGILDLAVDGTEFLLYGLLQFVQSLDRTVRLVKKAGLGVGARIVSSLVNDVGVVVATSAVPDENLDTQRVSIRKSYLGGVKVKSSILRWQYPREHQ